MHWELDEPTERAAKTYPLPISASAPLGQYGGQRFHTATWNRRVIQPSTWPADVLLSSPDQIIEQFTEEHYSQALALVVSWGGMQRQSKRIWGDRDIAFVETTLRDCAQSIRDSRSVASAWATLTGEGDGQLKWSPVITSKTLHFLCRALGFEQDPPVAIDNKVMLNCVWPTFCGSIPLAERPDGWHGNSFAAYQRYMTAILTWATTRHWTTTQLEATIFNQYYSR